MAEINLLTSASNNPLIGSGAVPGDAADLIRAVTDPMTGNVDTRRLAAVLHELGQRDLPAASREYAQIEAELSQRSPMTAAQFSRDVADAFGSLDNGAAPQPLAQLLADGDIRISPNASGAAAPAATVAAQPGATSVDYGNIPEEHRWRYDRYLESPSTKPKSGPNEWYAAAQRIWANNQSGNSFEQKVRTELGAPLGRGSKPVSIEGFVPDLPVGSDYGVTDIKNRVDINNTPQLKAFAQYAQENGLPFNLIIGPRTQGISGPVLDNVRATNGTVTEYDPVTHQFSGVELGESGYWRRPTLPTAGIKEGSLGGAAAGAAVSLIQLAATGQLTPQNLGQVAKGSGESAFIGAVAAKGEQLVAPVVDRAIGATVQNTASRLAATAVSTGGADTAGVVARTLASRVAGSTVVGAVITTGVSAWENRQGLMHGNSKAIGNVVADTAVGAGSIAAATAAGAAIGSVVPVAGTAIGAVAGLAVGLGITYGAQISGVRDAIAGGVAHAVDGIKSAASGVADAAKSVASGLSNAANSVAHFFGF